MTVWLIIFMLANGEQADASSEWRASKYECEQLRNTLEPENTAKDWTSHCIAWKVPADFAVIGPDGIDEPGAGTGSCDNTPVIRRLRELANKVDSLDGDVSKVASTVQKIDTNIRNNQRSIKSLHGSVRAIHCR